MNATTWYVARSAGIVAYLLLSTSVVVGVQMAGRSTFRWPKFAVQEVHRFLAILTAVFLLLHSVALLADRVVPTSVLQILIPFQTTYRPFAVGLGVTAALLLAAVGISNALRRRLPHRVWRRTHYLTLAVWLLATVHTLLAGTDRRDTWFLALVGASVCAVALSLTTRFARAATAGAFASVAAAAAAAVLALAFAPQQASATSHGGVGSYRGGALTAQVVGSAGTDGVLSVVGHAGGAGLRVDLLVAQGVVQQTSLALAFPSGGSCSGTVDGIDSTGLQGTCGGHRVSISWTIADDRSIAGNLRLAGA